MMKSMHMELTFNLKSEWHLGSGRDGGAYADNLVQKDHDGLPMINGKSIKGLLRCAFSEALKYQWLSQTSEETLANIFGREGTDLQAQGALKCDSATLNNSERNYFQHTPAAKEHLYRVRHSTAIDPMTQTAKEGSLRSMEVVIPMTIKSTLTLTTDNPDLYQHFFKWLELSLPLICALGGKRRRGLGEVLVNAICLEKH
jgi:CRISPR/Cas system CSM-associated protein Csm3 (group 7 of RAMP superfamily)